jgi:transcriptional regulator with PAS, ATPase and Fis domain
MKSKKRISEKKYLKAIEIINKYRTQINKEINKLDSIDKVNEKDIIERALKINNGNRSITAKHLNISERTLYRKIQKYSINL